MKIRSIQLCFQRLIVWLISISSKPYASVWEKEVPDQLFLPLLQWQPVLPAAWLAVVLANGVMVSNS